jgi:hypothetical protein
VIDVIGTRGVFDTVTDADREWAEREYSPPDGPTA